MNISFSGGGTFDVSILSLFESNFDVCAVDGDGHLGGQDFDNRLVNYFVRQFEEEHKKDLQCNPNAMNRLRRECEEVKKELSTATNATVSLDVMDCFFEASITRAQFEDICADLFLKTINPIERALASAGISKSEIDDVVLVGGSTRIPKIEELLTKFFGKTPVKKNINADEAGELNCF